MPQTPDISTYVRAVARHRRREDAMRAFGASVEQLDSHYVAGGILRRRDPEVIRLKKAIRRDRERAA